MSDAHDSHDAREADLIGPGLIHEMRHPLMGIKAGLELLARRLGGPLTSLDDFQMVSAQVLRLEELFRSYQQLFAPHPPGRFSLEAVVQRAVDLVAYRLRRLGTRFVWDSRGAHLAVGAQTAVLHALINLLVNACDAVPGETGRIEVRVLEAPLSVRVSDDGPGISPAIQARLFEPRATTKDGGTGLGLYFARRGMRGAGGDVRLVEAGDARRLPWAMTEFAVELETP